MFVFFNATNSNHQLNLVSYLDQLTQIHQHRKKLQQTKGTNNIYSSFTNPRWQKIEPNEMGEKLREAAAKNSNGLE
ncbi:uncharacterized [Tachysurus ichikawai]